MANNPAISASQLEIKITPAKPVFIAGESIVIRIDLAVKSEVTLESIELNRNRTQVLLTRLSVGNSPTQKWTGLDYARLHNKEITQEIGVSFRASPGKPVSSTLDLFQYTRPLAPGRYRLQLAYRCGDTEKESQTSNAIEFEVAPGKLRSVECRSFAGSLPQDHVELVWLSETNRQPRWFYQASESHDPGVPQFATDLEMPETAFISPPVLAHLNDMAAAHADRFVAWLESGKFAWMRVHSRGRIGLPRSVEHGLARTPLPQLVDPPLQLNNGNLAVMLTGVNQKGRPCAAWYEIPPTGAPRVTVRELAALPVQAVAVWTEFKDRSAGFFCATETLKDAKALRLFRLDMAAGIDETLLSTTGDVSVLAAYQWGGNGRLAFMASAKDSMHFTTWQFQPFAPAGSAQWPSADIALGESIGTVFAGPNHSLAILLHQPTGWVVLTDGGKQRSVIQNVNGAVPPKLVVTAQDKLFLIEGNGQGIITSRRLP